jgi:hypothetical protein
MLEEVHNPFIQFSKLSNGVYAAAEETKGGGLKPYVPRANFITFKRIFRSNHKDYPCNRLWRPIGL